jgi:hypothetical protein
MTQEFSASNANITHGYRSIFSQNLTLVLHRQGPPRSRPRCCRNSTSSFDFRRSLASVRTRSQVTQGKGSQQDGTLQCKVWACDGRNHDSTNEGCGTAVWYSNGIWRACREYFRQSCKKSIFIFLILIMLIYSMRQVSFVPLNCRSALNLEGT